MIRLAIAALDWRETGLGAGPLPVAAQRASPDLLLVAQHRLSPRVLEWGSRHDELAVLEVDPDWLPLDFCGVLGLLLLRGLNVRRRRLRLNFLRDRQRLSAEPLRLGVQEALAEVQSRPLRLESVVVELRFGRGEFFAGICRLKFPDLVQETGWLREC